MLNQPKPLRRRLKEKGMATMMTAFALIMLIPMAGLALDGGLAYIVKTRLSAAADSSALAAARGLNGGATITAAQQQATNLATAFFNGNFPTGYLNTDTANRSVVAHFLLGTGTDTTSGGNGVANGVLQVTVTASVNSSTFFMKYLGYPNLPISATGTATRRQLVLTLVLDKSSSMGSRTTTVGTIPATLNTATATSCEAMVYSAIQFLNYFSPYDYVGVVPFDYTAYSTYPPTTGYASTGGAAQQIANIDCGNNTNTTAALELAYRQIKNVGLPLANNVIVLFTDGVPNGVNGGFPVRYKTDTRVASVCSGGTAECSFNPCATTSGTVNGAIAQWSGFSYTPGFSMGGPFKSIDTDAAPTLPVGAGSCPSSGTDFVQQTIANLPDIDSFGNSASGPYDGWLYQVNPHTAPNGTPITPGNSATKNLGDLWSNYSTTGTGAPSNKFGSGNYSGKFRPDLPNSIGVVSMNTAVNEAYKIRNDTTYRPIIHTIYLQGNAGDPVDRAFLQIVTNQKQIAPLIYDSGQAAYANGYYASTQPTGLWLPTTSTAGLTSLFNQVASSLLRIAQ